MSDLKKTYIDISCTAEGNNMRKKQKKTKKGCSFFQVSLVVPKTPKHKRSLVYRGSQFKTFSYVRLFFKTLPHRGDGPKKTVVTVFWVVSMSTRRVAVVTSGLSFLLDPHQQLLRSRAEVNIQHSLPAFLSSRLQFRH